MAYSGISKANPLGGKNGQVEKLLSRWNPKELIKRIEYIHSLSENIVVTQCDALELIEEAYWDDSATIFIDPPYVEKGKDLYHCYYTEDDHISLSVMLNALHMGCPGADIIVTYDYSKWLDTLYEHPEKRLLVGYILHKSIIYIKGSDTMYKIYCVEKGSNVEAIVKRLINEGFRYIPLFEEKWEL